MIAELQPDCQDVLVKNMIYAIINLGASLAMTVEKDKLSERFPFNTEYPLIVEDITLLINDNKFFKLLELTKNGFNRCYNNVTKYRT